LVAFVVSGFSAVSGLFSFLWKRRCCIV
jgi:hypothetical protein